MDAFGGTESYVQSFEPWLVCNNLKKSEPLPYRKHRASKSQEQPLNAVWRNGRCLFWESHEADKLALWAKLEFLLKLNRMVYIFTTVL
jgi:hypothetical protein